MPLDESQKLASWDPYDQNDSAKFFDPEWMFDISDGFDIVIGNPPYVRQELFKNYKHEFRSVIPRCL
jgi:adenine-specific DNA-methyltransferase